MKLKILKVKNNRNKFYKTRKYKNVQEIMTALANRTARFIQIAQLGRFMVESITNLGLSFYIHLKYYSKKLKLAFLFYLMKIMYTFYLT